MSTNPLEAVSANEDLPKQIEDMAMRISVLWNRIHTELPVTRPEDRIKLLSPYPELRELEILGNHGGETAVEYFFRFKMAEIEGSGGTPAQKQESYRALLATFIEIEQEAKDADANIVGVPV